MEIILLGTGGGRWVTITQKISTGGFRIHASKNMHIDLTDAEVLIEAMTHGMAKQKGVPACSERVLVGKDNLGPAISRYHQSKIRKLEILKPGEEFNIYDLKVEAAYEAL